MPIAAIGADSCPAMRLCPPSIGNLRRCPIAKWIEFVEFHIPRMHCGHGRVIVTSSSFTGPAIERAQPAAGMRQVVLVDGELIVKTCIENQIGVEIVELPRLYRNKSLLDDLQSGAEAWHAEPAAAANRRGMAAFQGVAALPPRRWLSFIVRVRHEVADVAVLLSVERTDSTRCSASGILPGHACQGGRV